MGFLSLRRLRSREPSRSGLPHPIRCACRVRALLTPCFSRDLHGPVSCRARPWGFSPSKRFPSRRGRSPLGELFPSGRWLERDRGLRLAPRPAPGVCSLRKSVAIYRVVPPDGPRLPWAFLLFRGSSRSRRPAASRVPPLTSLAAACSSESRSRSGWFVSGETTAPLEVLAPRAGSCWFEVAATRADGFASEAGDLAVPERSDEGRTQPLPQARRIGCRCRSR